MHKTEDKNVHLPNMNQPADFFAEFEPVSKEQWLERISKDLKGKPLADLYWHLNPEITVDPFGHPDDLPAAPPLQAAPAGWVVNEDIEESADPAAANRQALEALAFGAGSVCFPFPGGNYSAVLHSMLDRIHPDYIQLHFGGPGVASGPAALLSALREIAREQSVSQTHLRGSLYYDPAAEPGQLRDWRYLEELMQYAGHELPGLRCVTVNGRTDHKGPEAAAGELAAILNRGLVYLEKLSARGMDPARIAGQMQFSLYIGKSYFVEIAKLRAFKILWINILNAFGSELEDPVLDVRFSPGNYTDSLYSNMICGTTMAMSAVLGGASRLTVLPYDTGREAQASYPRAFSRRIARNVQHLLNLESGLAGIADPAAGSYYLEKLTGQLAETAWHKMQTTRSGLN